MEITQARLKELFTYDPETGHFTRRIKVSNRHAGTIAGGINNSGYVMLRIDGKRCMAHRAAWLYMTGEWPVSEIDHINRNGFDNRFANLRDVTHLANLHNRSSGKAEAAEPHVYWDGRKGGRWWGCFTFCGRSHYTGSSRDKATAQKMLQDKVTAFYTALPPGYTPS
ncbi:HNH endonuclease signature motif containing protein [Pseudomonas paraversuta]|uniref:HNH endonuclease signature motif containing protein n=1 Tax=Pseudomonas paraversuta TaxID=2750624 RepID=UPI0019241D9F|nr:HNH endonuclease signature motif containing protein [Pseudomonas paraversuta]